MRYLLFQIAAHLMSFGNGCAKQRRTSDAYPGKAFALGVLGAALGKTRSDPWHDFSKDFGFAVMTVRPGSRLEDYHTVSTVVGDKSFHTRLEEVEASDYTIETWREYISDGYFVIALWGLGDSDWDEAVEALIHPTFELFAGRKSCPLCLPLAPEIVESATLSDAFRKYGQKLYPPLKPKGTEFALHWEPHPNPGIESTKTVLRNDQILSRQKRLYVQRTEHDGILKI